MPQLYRTFLTLFHTHGKNGVGQHVDVELLHMVSSRHTFHGFLNSGDLRAVAQQDFSHLKGKLQDAVALSHSLTILFSIYL